MSSPGDGRVPDERPGPDPAPPGPAEAWPGPPSGQLPHGPAQPADLPYVYNPYSNYQYPASYPASPAGLGPEPLPPPRRPRLLHLALLLVVLSSLPYVLVGVLALAGAGQAATALPPEDLAQLQELGVDLAQVVRITGVLLLAIALLYVLLGVLAWTGRRWARALLALLTVGFMLMVAASVLAAGSQGLALDAGSVVVLGLPLTLALLGLGLMFHPAARDWFARRR